MNLISRATALLPNDDPLRVDLIPNVRAIQGAADLGWADAILQEAIASGDPRLRAHALVQRGFLRLFLHDSTSRAEELIEVAEDAISVFEKARDDLGLARAWRLMAQSHYLARNGRSSAEAAETGLTFARQSGDRFEQQEIVEWLGIALVLGPTTGAEGAAICRRSAGRAGRRSEDGAHPHRRPGVHGGNPGTDRGGRAARRRSDRRSRSRWTRPPGSFRSCSPSSWRG